jgi:hypothetical protein
MPNIGVVAAAGLNFRMSPNGPVIRVLPRGTPVEILEDQGDWLEVSVDGLTGFVSATFIDRQPGADVPDGQPASSTGVFRFEGTKAVAPDGSVFGVKFKLGIYNYGNTSIGQFVSANSARFPGVSPSRLRVMQAVSNNEGKLEAINTWDNAFLTFGAFQWTAGTLNGAGELPALIDRLKLKYPAVFQQYFGQYGLGTSVPPAVPGVTPTGFFLLNGVMLNTPGLKQRLRTLEWAYRFWISGCDESVQEVEVEHAMQRVDEFYRDSRHMIGSRYIADYVTSEYGVALILDEHVNRPGHVPGTIAKAVNQFVAQPGANDPQGWTDAEESDLLDIYIQLRAQTNMTDSTKRANTIRQAVSAGLASARRGSYQP